MTSEKLLKDKGRNLIALQLDMLMHRLWLIAFSGLAFFLLYFVIPLIVLIHEKNVLVIQQDIWIRSSLLNLALSLYGFNAEWMPVMVYILAVLFAFSGFFYLYKMNSLDFYESQPFTRLQRYLMILVNNMLIFVPVICVATVIGMAVTLIFGGIRLIIYFEMILQMIRLIILFFAVCGMATLAAVLSGNIVIAILMMGFLTLAELFTRLLFTACGEAYFTTSNGSLNFVPYLWGITSPVVYDTAHMLGKSYAYSGLPTSRQLVIYAGVMPHLLVVGVIGAVFFAAGYFAYKYRKLEHTGRGLCYPFAESIVKVVIAMVVGMYAGLMTDIVMETQHVNVSFAFFLLVILTVALTCIIGEIIFAKSLHAFKRRAWQIPVCIVVCFVVLYIYKCDVVGYDSYVPDPSKVESASISFGQYYYDESVGEGSEGMLGIIDDGSLNFEYGSLLERMELTGPQVEALCEIAKIAMPRQREVATSVKDYDYYMGSANYEIYDVSVVYRLKSGRHVARHMAIPYSIDEGLMDAVIGSDSYKAARFDTAIVKKLIANPEYMRQVTVTCSYEYGGSTMSMVLAAEDVAKLMDAYEKDMAEYSYSFAKSRQAIGAVSMEFSSRYGQISDLYPDSFSVYDSYRNTIACLKELSLYHDPSYTPDEVEFFEMYLTDQMNDEEREAFNDVLYGDDTHAPDLNANILRFDEPEQVEALCEVFACMTYFGDWYPSVEEDCYTLYAHVYDTYNNSVYGSVPKDKAPDFLKKGLTNALK